METNSGGPHELRLPIPILATDCQETDQANNNPNGQLTSLPVEDAGTDSGESTGILTFEKIRQRFEDEYFTRLGFKELYWYASDENRPLGSEGVAKLAPKSSNDHREWKRKIRTTKIGDLSAARAYSCLPCLETSYNAVSMSLLYLFYFLFRLYWSYLG
mmetsp:Transcript_7315/g.9552  ORF Transcript_7315/g.9552 Transcript_7315/m.9552 type:complete len:159 (+) Transcript_7315:355-831(+)